MLAKVVTLTDKKKQPIAPRTDSSAVLYLDRSGKPTTVKAALDDCIRVLNVDVGDGDIGGGDGFGQIVSDSDSIQGRTPVDEVLENNINLVSSGAVYKALENLTASDVEALPDTTIFCNPNLLKNWYFKHPVNSKGQNSYSGFLSSFIDGWRFHATQTSYDVPSYTLTFGGQDWSGITQDISHPEQLANNSATMSFLLQSEMDCFIRVVCTDDSGNITYERSTTITPSDTFQLYSLLISPPDCFHMEVQLVGANFVGNCQIVASKLEIGTRQTLAHQDVGGLWVLNELPDYDLEKIIIGGNIPIHRNLLRNWYFEHPVNSRGASNYTGKYYIPIIDGWMLHRDDSTYDVPTHTITMSNYPWSGISQNIGHIDMIAGKTLTMSAIVQAEVPCQLRFIQFTDDNQYVYEKRTDIAITTRPILVQMTFIAHESTMAGIQVIGNGVPGKCRIYAMKLELGNVQTLARTYSDGTVVLLEIPDYEEEFYRCMVGVNEYDKDSLDSKVLLAYQKPDINGMDCNDLVIPGRYTLNSNCLNLPIVDWFQLDVIGNGPGYLTQLAYCINSNIMYMRRRVNNTWCPWDQIITRSILEEAVRRIIQNQAV